MKHLFRILALNTVTLFTVAQDKPAAPTTPTPAPNPTARPLPPNARDPRDGRSPQRFDRTSLDLTPEQRTKLDEINRTYATNATPLFARLGTARRELEANVNEDTYNEADIRAKAK
jgi:Spy/CpxP family protein refolding chaperone